MKSKPFIPFVFFMLLNIGNLIFSQPSDLMRKNLKGNVLEVISYYYNRPALIDSRKVDKGELKTMLTTTYNDLGNELSFSDGQYRTISEYDENGYKIGFRLEDDSGAFQSVKIENNSRGKRVSEIVYNARKTIIGKRLYTRNRDTTIVLEFGYPQLEIPKNKSLYNRNGNKIHEEKFNQEGDKLLAISFRYNKDQLLVFKSQFNYGHSVTYSETKYVYNQNNDLVHKMILEKKGNVIYRYEYEYDDKQNWTSKTEYENDIVVQVQERKIKYYP